MGHVSQSVDVYGFGNYMNMWCVRDMCDGVLWMEYYMHIQLLTKHTAYKLRQSSSVARNSPNSGAQSHGHCISPNIIMAITP